MENERNPYDPLKVAEEKGNVIGKGASGHYKKNLLTRIGFILLGAPFLGLGIVLAFFVFQGLVTTNSPFEYMDRTGALFTLVFSLGFIVLGAVIIKNALSKEKVK